MEITSVTFLFFVGVSLLIYWIMPKGYQWIVLLADSMIFYFLNAEWYTIIYLLVSVMTVWMATNFFLHSEDEKKKKTVLVCTLIVNIGMLAVLKYTNLAIGTVNALSSEVGGVETVRWTVALHRPKRSGEQA